MHEPTLTGCTAETLAAYDDEVGEYMTVKRWRAIKGLTYTVLTLAFALTMVELDADPTVVFVAAVPLILVFYVGEVREIELLRGISVLFPDDGDEGGE